MRRRPPGQTFAWETPPPRTPRAPAPSSRTRPAGLRPRVAGSRLGRELPPLLRSAPGRACSDSTLLAMRCAPPGPAVRSPPHPTPWGRGIACSRLGRPFLPWLVFGVRPFGARAWAAGRPAGSGRAAGTGRLQQPCRAGAGRPPGFPPLAGLDPGTAWPFARKRDRAGLCAHLAHKKLSRPWRPGGRVRLRLGERNRQVGVYFQKRRGGAEAPSGSLPKVSLLEEISPRRGSLRHRQDLISFCSL